MIRSVVIGAVVILFAIGLGVGLFARRKPSPPPVASYDELRKEVVRSVKPSSPSTATRPPALDGRLPRAALERIKSLPAPNKENWRERYDAWYAVQASVFEELAAIDPEHDRYDLIWPVRRAIVLAQFVDMEVCNGGFDQYYFNSSGNGAALAPEALRMLGLVEAASIVERANAQFQGGPSSDRGTRMQQLAGLSPEAAKALSELDHEFYGLGDKGRFEPRIQAWILAHEADFFKPD